MTGAPTGIDLEAIIRQYADEIGRSRYSSFRGTIKDGNIVLFAVEHEWRPQRDADRSRPEARLESRLGFHSARTEAP